jgi:hypothetical protein
MVLHRTLSRIKNRLLHKNKRRIEFRAFVICAKKEGVEAHGFVALLVLTGPTVLANLWPLALHALLASYLTFAGVSTSRTGI